MGRMLTLTTLVHLGATVVSCAPAIPDARVIRSRHVELHASQADLPCAASMDFADAFIERWSQRFAVNPPRIRVFLNDQLRAFACPSSTSVPVAECAIGTDVYSSSWVHKHELIHTIAHAAFGRAPQFLEEGLAVWAAEVGDESGQLRLLERVDLEPIVESEAWVRAPNAGARYESAGHFVAFLVRRFGLPRVLAVYDALDLYSSRAQTDAAFGRVFGDSFTTIHAEWLRSTTSERTGDDSLAMVCESSPRATLSDALPTAATCEASVQPWGIDAIRVVTFDGGPVAVEGASASNGLLVGLCAEQVVLHDGMQPDVLWVRAGATAMRTRGATPLRLRSLGATPARCEEALPIDMGTRSLMTMLDMPSAWSQVDGSRRTWLRVRHDRAPRVHADFVFNSRVREQAVTVEVCDGCGDRATCRQRTLQEQLSIDVSPSSTEVVRITTSERTPIASFSFAVAN